MSSSRTLLECLPVEFECPVCREPMTGENDGVEPMDVCGSHHLVCYGCARRIKVDGDARCPTCRDPMRNAFVRNTAARRLISAGVAFCKEVQEVQQKMQVKEKAPQPRGPTMEQHTNIMRQLSQLQARMLDLEENREMVSEQLSEVTGLARDTFASRRVNLPADTDEDETFVPPPELLEQMGLREIPVTEPPNNPVEENVAQAPSPALEVPATAPPVPSRQSAFRRATGRPAPPQPRTFGNRRVNQNSRGIRAVRIARNRIASQVRTAEETVYDATPVQARPGNSTPTEAQFAIQANYFADPPLPRDSLSAVTRDSLDVHARRLFLMTLDHQLPPRFSHHYEIAYNWLSVINAHEDSRETHESTVRAICATRNWRVWNR